MATQIRMRLLCLFALAISKPVVARRADEKALEELNSQAHPKCLPEDISITGKDANLGSMITVKDEVDDQSAEIVKMNVMCAYGYTSNAKPNEKAFSEITVECSYSADKLKGTWTPESVTCLPILCQIPNVEHAIEMSNEALTPAIRGDFKWPWTLDDGFHQYWYHGMTAVATCEEGYSVDGTAGGSKELPVSCHAGKNEIGVELEDEQFKGDVSGLTRQECRPILCPEDDTLGANVARISQLVFGESVQATCVEGYKSTVEAGKWECGPNGKFRIQEGSGSAPNCVPKDCGDPLAGKPNAEYATFSGETTFPNKGKIQCGKDRTFGGVEGATELELTCTAEGVWDKSSSALCLVTECTNNPTDTQTCSVGETFDGEKCNFNGKPCALERSCDSKSGVWSPPEKTCTPWKAKELNFLDAGVYTVDTVSEPVYQTVMFLSCAAPGTAFDGNSEKLMTSIKYVVGKDAEWRKENEDGEILSAETVPACQAVTEFCPQSAVQGCNARNYGATCEYTCPAERCRTGSKTVLCESQQDGKGGIWRFVGVSNAKSVAVNAQSLLAQCTDYLKCELGSSVTAEIDAKKSGKCASLQGQKCSLLEESQKNCVDVESSTDLDKKKVAIGFTPNAGYNVYAGDALLAVSGAAESDKTKFKCGIEAGQAKPEWRNNDKKLANTVVIKKKSCGKIEESDWWIKMFKNQGAGKVFTLSPGEANAEGFYQDTRTLVCKSKDGGAISDVWDDKCFQHDTYRKNADITLTCEDQEGQERGQWKAPTATDVQQCVSPIGVLELTSDHHANAASKVLEYHANAETPVKHTIWEGSDPASMNLDQLWFIKPTGGNKDFTLRPASAVDGNICMGAKGSGSILPWYQWTEGYVYFGSCQEGEDHWEPTWRLSCGNTKESICDGGSRYLNTDLLGLCQSSTAPCSLQPSSWSPEGKSKFWLTFPRKSDEHPKVIKNSHGKMWADDRDLTVLTFWK